MSADWWETCTESRGDEVSGLLKRMEGLGSCEFLERCNGLKGGRLDNQIVFNFVAGRCAGRGVRLFGSRLGVVIGAFVTMTAALLGISGVYVGEHDLAILDCFSEFEAILEVLDNLGETSGAFLFFGQGLRTRLRAAKGRRRRFRRRFYALVKGEALIRVAHVLVDVVDVGGESTRPGASPVDVGEELDRVIGTIFAIKQRFDVPVSIDTSCPQVISAAAAAGVLDGSRRCVLHVGAADNAAFVFAGGAWRALWKDARLPGEVRGQEKG